MTWTVRFDDAFESEFEAMPQNVRESLAAAATLLATYGPRLGRPYVDSLAGSKHSNMKELRFNAQSGVWRVAFAFDSARQAILLVAGDKAGVAQKRFYKVLIDRADGRFAAHLNRLKVK